MRIFLCYVCPPLAVLFCGKPFTAILTLIMTIFGWKPGVHHALLIVNNHFQDKRIGGMTKAINQPKWVKERMGDLPGPMRAPMQPGPSFAQNPLSWGYRKGKQLGTRPQRCMPQAPINDPTIGANGTRFPRR